MKNVTVLILLCLTFSCNKSSDMPHHQKWENKRVSNNVEDHRSVRTSFGRNIVINKIYTYDDNKFCFLVADNMQFRAYHFQNPYVSNWRISDAHMSRYIAQVWVFNTKTIRSPENEQK